MIKSICVDITRGVQKRIIIAILFFATNTVVHAQFSKSIVDYGARADTNMLNTKFIQQCIDDASAAGGGTVIVPAGEFRTGSIVLKSGVNLHLEEGAIIAGSDKRKDYENYQKPALIIAVQQHDISITGSGTVDGRGRELMKDIFKRLEEGTLTDPNWRLTRPGEGIRTNLFYFEACDGIKVNGIKIKDATSWVTHYERCTNISIDNIHLESVAYWNNDGIDIVDCKKVRITNSYINAADDAICLKSARRGDYCDSIYVENCTLRSSANAFKLGTGSVGGFKNITVRNLKVFDTYRSAIALEAVDGGFLENVDIRNVVATNTGSAILVRLGHRNKDDMYSTVKNIYIGNITVEVPAGKPDAGYEMEGPLLMYPPDYKAVPGVVQSISPWNYKEKMPGATVYKHNVFPSSISGLPGHPVENITLENIEITYKGGGDKSINYIPLDSFNMITEATKDYPEFSMFGELPVWGLYMRHVSNISVRKMMMVQQKEDYRTAVLINDGKQIQLNKLMIQGNSVTPAVLINDVRGLHLKKVDAGKAGEIDIRNSEQIQRD